MSVDQRFRANKVKRRNTPRLVGPGQWSLWTVSRPFLTYVLAVDIAAVATVALTASLVPISSRDLMWFIALGAGSVLHLEATRQVERLRELHAVGSIYTNLQSIWTFAGLILLP